MREECPIYKYTTPLHPRTAALVSYRHTTWVCYYYYNTRSGHRNIIYIIQGSIILTVH